VSLSPEALRDDLVELVVFREEERRLNGFLDQEAARVMAEFPDRKETPDDLS
jgi:hypothetical protein